MMGWGFVGMARFRIGDILGKGFCSAYELGSFKLK
jgi:hypothetical protein